MTDRELDVLVAEKVFGKRIIDALAAGKFAVVGDDEKTPWEIIPRYSTSIASAWEVFEKLGGFHGIGYSIGRQDWTAYFQISIDHPTHRASDKSAAKAICLAALEAVGVDVPATQPAQKQGEQK